MAGGGLLPLFAGGFILAGLIFGAIAIPIAIHDNSGDDEGTNVRILYDEQCVINPPQDVQFYCDILEGSPYSFLWEWGNGSFISNEQNPVIHFEEPGTFEIILTSDNMELGIDTDSVMVETGPESSMTDTIIGDRYMGMDFPGSDIEMDQVYNDLNLQVDVYPYSDLLVNHSAFFMVRTQNRFGSGGFNMPSYWLLWSFGDGSYYYYDYSDFDPENMTSPFAITYGSGTYPPDYDPSNPIWWSISRTFHTYTDPGIYNVTFLIGIDNGFEVVNISDTLEVTVTSDIQIDQEFPDIGDRFNIDLVVDPDFGFFPLLVELTATVSNSIPGEHTYNWVLGNGLVAITTVPSFNYTYTEPGLYQVDLIVVDRIDRIFRETVMIDVQGPDSPQPVIMANDRGGGRLDLTGDVTNRNNLEVTYTWYLNEERIGDGKHIVTQPFPLGISIISLEVEDEQGRKGYAEIEIDLSNDSVPVVFFQYQQNPFDQSLFLFYPSVFSGNHPQHYFWDFGDGGYSVTQNPNHIFPGHGMYEVTLTVTDSDGDKDSYTQAIEVVLTEF